MITFHPLAPHHLPFAVDLYRAGLEWSPCSCPHLPNEIAEQALLAPNSTWWVALDEHDGMVGLCGLERINWIDRTGEPYIAVVEARRGTGLASQLAAHAFHQATQILNLRRFSSILVIGTPSEHLLKELGFQAEGIHRKARWKDGAYHDLIVYAYVKE